ncbi:MAG: anhydro-N-acetylmuramic acid kinase, partial [Gammaproteobacteria bacterium]
MLAIGLMSGTSMDGVDAALLETDGELQIKSLGHLSLSYDTASSEEILHNTTAWHQKAVEQLLRYTHYSSKSIDIIGYHGQTILHKPTEGISVQRGDPQILANTFGIPVISQFRQNDLQHGGQGAPLAPLYHQALAIRDGLTPVAIVNIGGIANITLITGPDYKDIFACDTGPGNTFIDRYLKLKTENKVCMDKDGRYGLRGKIHQHIITALYEKSAGHYFTLSAPKSLDLTDLTLIPELNELSIEDACATLAAFTAHTIINSIKTAPPVWVIAGGGAKNPVIMRELARSAHQIKTADEI